MIYNSVWVRGAVLEGRIAGAGSERECRTACSRSGSLALRNEEGLPSRQHIEPGTTLLYRAESREGEGEGLRR